MIFPPFRRAAVRGATILLLVLATAGVGRAAGVLDAVIGARDKENDAAAHAQDVVDRLSDETESLRRDYAETLRRINALRVYNAQVQRLVTAQQKEMAGLREQIDRASDMGRELTPLMLRMVDALAHFVQLDVPFLPVERRRRVASLRSLMDRPDVAESEKYRRILEAYQIENEYGRTIEAYQGELKMSGRSRTVDFLRIGRVALIYQTLDGSEIGAWDHQNGHWVRLPRSYRLAVRRGLRIARKQAAPDLIRLPIPAAEAAR